MTFAGLDARAQAAVVADKAECLAVALVDDAKLSPLEAGRVCLVAAMQLLSVALGGRRRAAAVVAAWARTVTRKPKR